MKEWGSLLWLSLIINGLANAAPSPVQLKGLFLDMNELVLEASRQCDIAINIEEDFPAGPKIHYDCSSSLEQILKAIRGYIHFHTGKKLLEQWSSDSVSLTLPRQHQLPKQVAPEDNIYPKRELKPLPILAALKKIWNKAKAQQRESNGRRQQQNSSETQSTKVKKMNLSPSPPQQPTAPDEALHPTIMVETVPPSHFKALDLFPKAVHQQQQPKLRPLSGPEENDWPHPPGDHLSDPRLNSTNPSQAKINSKHDLPDL